MSIQRLLILAYAAAFTAGTASANSISFAAFVGSGGTQTLSVTVGGTLVGTYSGPGSSGQVLSASATEPTDGWYSIAIDFQSAAANPGLSLYMNSNPSDIDLLASYDALGNIIHGLTGTYYAPGGTTKLATDYGENPKNLTPNNTPWSNYNTWNPFEEQLSGYVWVGAGSANYSLVPAQIQSPPPDGGGGDSNAPEPATWWLMAAALPLMMFSRLRLKTAKMLQ